MSNRRSFIKAIASTGIFACLPVIEIRQGISMELLSRFTDQYSSRWDMQKPFVEQSMASATDGRIGVRVADSLRLADEDNPLKIPPLANVFEQCWNPSRLFQDWPFANYEQCENEGLCHVCNARGGWGERSDCEKCYGTGSAMPETDGWDDFGDPCKFCSGGDVWSTTCPKCKGTGEGTARAMQLDDEIRVGAGYHHLASMLPGVRWSVAKTRIPERQNAGCPVLLEFEGGQAMLMPLADS